jgi:hypothetical protein
MLLKAPKVDKSCQKETTYALMDSRVNGKDLRAADFSGDTLSMAFTKEVSVYLQEILGLSFRRSSCSRSGNSEVGGCQCL